MEERTEANMELLLAIDAAIEAAAEKPHNDTTNLASQTELAFSQAILEYLHAPDEAETGDPLGAAFELAQSIQARELIAASILRLMAVDDALFSGGTPFAAAAMRFLDGLPKKQLYSRIELEPDAQTYVKLEKLRTVIPEFERKAQRIIDSYKGLEQLKDSKEKLLQLLNSRDSFPIRVFSPENVAQQLRAAATDTEEFASTDGRKAVTCFDTAKSSVEELIATCREFGTSYARKYFEAFGQLTLQYLQARFAISPFGKCADLVLTVGGKRYPLQSKDIEVALAFSVENKGPGVAYDVRLVLDTNEDLEVWKPEQYLGTLESDSPIVVTFESTIRQESDSCETILTASWCNFDETEQTSVKQFSLSSQERQIDWEYLAEKELYSLEPVESVEDLVGRDKVLRDLVKRTRAPSVGSSYLHGQKRVGKTSIARTLRTTIQEAGNQNRIAVLLEAGQFVTGDAPTTINAMGEAICKKIIRSDPRFAHATVPKFDGALAPLTGFLEELQSLAPDVRILIILDEFDELPPELYKQSGQANALFQTLRAIGNERHYGLMLVGGENLQFIINEQGSRLNKFNSVTLSYFDRRTQWTDFCNLVRRPVEPWLDVTDEAIEAIWNITAGHPYYTKAVCQKLFEMMVERRDGHVTEREVGEVARTLIPTLGAQAFQHF